MKLKILLKTAKNILILGVFITKVHAQTIPPAGVEITKAIPASADAAALGKYGRVPVSTFTGIPNISIPLYTIKSGDLTLPVSLTYHAGGIKVEETASSVGLGWALSAGGSITRTVRGTPDEDLNGYLSANNYPWNIYQALFAPHNTGNLTATNAGILLNSFIDGTYDGEADIFNFNFAGYSGQFVIKNTTGGPQGNTAIMVSPQQNIKFLPLYTPGSMFSFVAQTPDGVKYYFGSNDGVDAVEYTSTHGKSYAMSWLLKRIVSPTGSEIDFNYNSQVYTQAQPGGTLYRILSGPTTDGSGNLLETDNSYSTASSVHTMQLSSITFENGTLQVYANLNRMDINSFNSPTGAKMIDTIAITSAGLSKLYKFYHTNNSSARLRLDSLIGQLEPISGGSGYKKEKYSFSYIPDQWSTSTSFQCAQDWWGYYNGYNQTTIVPWMYDPLNPSMKLSGAERMPSATAMTAGILTRISYPSGGHTDFTFEPNQEPGYDFGADTYVDHFQTTAISNDPASIYRNYDNNNGNPSNFMYIYNAANTGTRMPVHLTAYGLQLGFNPIPPPHDNVNAIIYKKDAQGNYTTNIYAITNTDTTVFLDQGYYQIRLSDPKSQTDSTIFYDYVKYAVVATWNNPTPATGHYHGHTAGGLRIAKIADYDGSTRTPFNVRTYKYNLDDTTSSGFLNFQNQYSYNLTLYSGSISSLATSVFLVRTANSNYPLATQQGAVVGYYHVEEDLDNNGVKGKNDYYYSINGQGAPGTGFPFAPPTTKDWLKGLLTDQVTSKYVSNGVYAKVREKKNVYTTINPDTCISIKAGFNPFPFNYASGIDYYGGSNMPGSVGTSIAQAYLDLTDYTYISSDTTWVYNSADATKSVKTSNNYQYDPGTYQLTRLQTLNSKNELLTQSVTYPGSSTSFVRGVSNLSALGILSYPIEEVTTRSDANGTTNLRTVKAVLTTYKTNKPFRDSVYEMRSVAPLTNFSSIVNGAKDSRYKPVVSFDKYDQDGNIIQERKVGDALHCYLWGYKNPNLPGNNSYPIAEVINADSASIAYTNFESLDRSNTGLGNWVYANANTTTDATAPMGSKCFTVSGSATLVKSGLNTATGYVVSFWSKSGASITVTGGTVTNVATGNAKSGWLYHEYKVTGASTVTIGGSGLIDELRLYPVNAQMSTYTYIPLVGMASKCDTRNDITYYNFDTVGRLTSIQDQNRNILKDYQYNYVNQGAVWTNVAGTLRCLTDTYGNYTGEQEVQQTDTNPYSSTYLQSRVQSLGNQLTACPPTSVFAKMILVSSFLHLGITTNTYEVDLYSDSNCTIRYTAPANLTVNYTVHTVSTTPPNQVTLPHTAVVLTGTNNIRFSVNINDCSPTGGSGCTADVAFVGGTGYLLGGSAGD